MPIQSTSLTTAFRPWANLLSQAHQAPANCWTGRTLADRNPQVIEQLMPLWDWLHRHYFRVTSEGWEQVPATEPILMVGSHNGGLGAPDMFMLMLEWYQRFGGERLAYGLMNAKMWQVYPGLARLAAQAGAIQADPKMAIAALQQGASVLVYPGGARDVFRPHAQRDRIFLNGNLAFIKLALRHNVPIVPVVSWGAHDTLRVLFDLYPLLEAWHQQGMPWPYGLDPEIWPVFLGWPWGIGVGPIPNLPWPEAIHLQIGKPIRFGRSGAEVTRDLAYVIACYDQVYQQMQQSLNQIRR